MAIVKEAEVGNEMGFSAHSQKWLGREGEQSGCRGTSHWCTSAGSGFSTRPGVKTCAWGQILRLPEEDGESQFPYLENREVGLGKSFALCGPQTSSINVAWKLVRNADSQASLRPTESETVEVGPSNPCLTSPPGDLKEFTNQPLVDNV